MASDVTTAPPADDPSSARGSAYNDLFGDEPVPPSEPETTPVQPEPVIEQPIPVVEPIKPTEVPVETKPAAPAVPEPTIDTQVVEWAKTLGVNDETIKTIGTTEGLRAVCNATTSRLAEFGKSLLPKEPQQPTPAEAKPKAQPGDWKLKRDPTEYDPAVAEELQGLNEYWKGRFQSFQDEVAQAFQQTVVPLNQQVRNIAEAPNRAKWNAAESESLKAFAEAGIADKYNGQAVRETARGIALGLEKSGLSLPDLQVLHRMAVNTVHSAEMRQIQLTNIARQVQKQAEGSIDPPVSKRGKPASDFNIKSWAKEQDAKLGISAAKSLEPQFD